MDLYEAKTLKDTAGDETRVEASRFTVDMACTEGGHTAYMEFAPEQARKLAKALKEAAKAVEVEQGRVA